MQHSITIDFTRADSIDTASFQAFCDNEICGWSGEHHHADYPEDDQQALDTAEQAAQEEGNAHLDDVESV